MNHQFGTLRFNLKDSEEQDRVSGVVSGGPFPTLHCSTFMMYQFKHVQQKKGRFSTTIEGICINTWRISVFFYI